MQWFWKVNDFSFIHLINDLEIVNEKIKEIEQILSLEQSKWTEVHHEYNFFYNGCLTELKKRRLKLLVGLS